MNENEPSLDQLQRYTRAFKHMDRVKLPFIKLEHNVLRVLIQLDGTVSYYPEDVKQFEMAISANLMEARARLDELGNILAA